MALTVGWGQPFYFPPCCCWASLPGSGACGRICANSSVWRSEAVNPGNRRIRLGKLNAKLDTWLWERGIRVELSRRVLCSLIPLSAVAAALGVILLPLTLQILCFALGAAFAGINLFLLTRTVGRLIVKNAGPGRRLLAGLFFFARLFLTVFLLLLIIRYEPFAVIGLLAGFSTVLAALVLFGLSRPTGSP